MSQFKKVVCVYHPDQFITNFCKQQTCLMPLCPSCIGTHTQYHNQNGFRATYYNILDVLTETETKIYALMGKLQQAKKRNENILGGVYNLPNIIHEKILLAKSQAYNVVDNALQELQNQIILQLQKKHQQNGVYSLDKIQHQQNILKNAIVQLDNMDYTLKGQKCLASVIKFYAQTQQQFNVLYQQLSAQATINQSYFPNFTLNKSIFSGIKHIISKSVKLELNFPTKNTEIMQQSRKRFQVNEQSPLPQSRVSKVLSNSQMKRGIPYIKDLTPSKKNPIIVQQIYQPVQIQNNNYSPNQNNINRDISPRKSNLKKGGKYEQEFEALSKKLSEMRKQNELLAKALKKT